MRKKIGSISWKLFRYSNSNFYLKKYALNIEKIKKKMVEVSG